MVYMKELTTLLHTLLRDAARSGDWSNIPVAFQTPKFGMLLMEDGDNPLLIASKNRMAHKVPKSMYPPSIGWILDMCAQEDLKRAELHTLGIPSPEL
jgi:hypothetical protein